MLVVEAPQTPTKDGLIAALEHAAEPWESRIEIEDGAPDLLRR